MEGLFALLAIAAGGLILLAPILAIVALTRVRRLEVDLAARLDAIEARLMRAARATAAPAAQPATAPQPAAALRPPASAAPAVTPAPATAAPPGTRASAKEASSAPPSILGEVADVPAARPDPASARDLTED